MLREKRTLGRFLLGFGGGGLPRVLLAELLDAAGGVHELLLAGVERVALRAHFNLELVASKRGAGVPLVAAAAGDGDGAVFGVNLRFHVASVPMGSDRKARIIRNLRAECK